MEIPDLSATGTYVMAISQSIDYRKFGRFSNVADEISARLFSSFFEYEMLVAATLIDMILNFQ